MHPVACRGQRFKPFAPANPEAVEPNPFIPAPPPATIMPANAFEVPLETSSNDPRAVLVGTAPEAPEPWKYTPAMMDASPTVSHTLRSHTNAKSGRKRRRIKDEHIRGTVRAVSSRRICTPGVRHVRDARSMTQALRQQGRGGGGANRPLAALAKRRRRDINSIIRRSSSGERVHVCTTATGHRPRPNRPQPSPSLRYTKGITHVATDLGASPSKFQQTQHQPTPIQGPPASGLQRTLVPKNTKDLA